MKFYLSTDHPVALDSPDHTCPRGTMLDNSQNPKFNKRLRDMYDWDGRLPSVLDLGCAGGGLVQSLVEDGHIAIGLEGSDYNLVNQRAAWAEIPDCLFTCDLGYPFTLHTGDGQPYKFDIITAWEFLEHMPEDRLDTLIDNIGRHLRYDGLFIGSIANHGSAYNGIEHHLTRKFFWWWMELFGNSGYERRTDLEMHFECAKAWVRKVQFNFVLEKGE